MSVSDTAFGNPVAMLTRRTAMMLTAATSLIGCGREGRFRRAGSASARVRIGYQKNGVLLLAKSRGRLARALAPAGVKIEWAQFVSGPLLLEALAGGAVDMGAAGDAPPLFAQAAGAPIRYVAVQPLTGHSEAILVPRDSAIGRVDDLRGQRLAFTRGSSSHLLVIRALARQGLSLGDVEPVLLNPADASAAFASGALGAWATWDPYLALAQRDQNARILIDGAAVARCDAFLLASERLVQDAPAVLARVLDALRAEAVWSRAHRPDLIRIVSQASGLSPDIVGAGLRRGDLAVEPMSRDVIARQQASADIFARLGVIPRAIDVKDAAWTGWTPR
jgi:sulfonate transport system substrate-binding protein